MPLSHTPLPFALQASGDPAADPRPVGRWRDGACWWVVFAALAGAAIVVSLACSANFDLWPAEE